MRPTHLQLPRKNKKYSKRSHGLRLTARVVLGADGLAPTDRGTLDVSSMTKAGTINPVFSPGAP